MNFLSKLDDSLKIGGVRMRPEDLGGRYIERQSFERAITESDEVPGIFMHEFVPGDKLLIVTSDGAWECRVLDPKKKTVLIDRAGALFTRPRRGIIVGSRLNWFGKSFKDGFIATDLCLEILVERDGLRGWCYKAMHRIVAKTWFFKGIAYPVLLARWIGLAGQGHRIGNFQVWFLQKGIQIRFLLSPTKEVWVNNTLLLSDIGSLLE